VRTARRRSRALGQYAVVIAGAVLLNFALPRLAPGSPVDYLVPPQAGTVSEEERAELLDRYGLDESVPRQLATYLGGLTRGDLGVSVRDGRPVRSVIGERLGWTLLLVGGAVVLSALLGTAMGFLAAWRRGSGTDLTTLVTVLIVDSLPAFFVGLLLLLAFSVRLDLFPLYGAVPAAEVGGLQLVGEVARRLALPLATLTLTGLASIFVVARSALLSELDEDYVFMARAKGLDERGVRGHAQQNALLPISTATFLGFSTLIGAATVVETVFSYPGLGTLAFQSVLSRDYPMLQAVFLVLALIAIAANLVNDLVYPRLDPRVRAR
jgi:peptide/nickel transport system permease protein